MKYIVLIMAFVGASLGAPVDAAGTPDYRGLLLLQVQSYGRMWYVSPVNNRRYYLKDPAMAHAVIKKLGSAAPSAKHSRGSFVAVKNSAWYIHPRTGVRVFLGATDTEIFKNLRKYARGVKDTQLRTVPMNNEQVVPDTAFGSVASASLHNGARDGGQYADTILPLASLTKLMTALVLLDTAPQWDRTITITEREIAYPKRFVGDDTTSEVSLRAGQRVSVDDLWTAMLISSSNQAAIALIDSTVLSEKQFVAQMNIKAHALGLTKTLFFDGAGLDAHTVSTAYETAVLAHEAFSHAKIAGVSSQKEATITIRDHSGIARSLPIRNRNYSVLAFEPDGVKTGFLVEAQRNVALKKGDTIVVVLHARSMNERNATIKKLL